MKFFVSYKGTLNGAEGIWRDKVPEGAIVTSERRVYVADEGKIFKKGDEYTEIVFDTIRDWEEVPEVEEEAK